MPDFPQALLSPLGAIFAALIAALFSFVGLIITKENKVSELRQAWIDGLRADLASYSAAVALLAHAESAKKQNGNREDYLKTFGPTYESVINSQTCIRLRINLDDTDAELNRLNKELLNTLERIRTLVDKSDYEEAATKARNIHEQAAPILKLEWKRVRDGEPIYRKAKWVVGIIITLATLTFCLGISSMIYRSLLTKATATPAAGNP